ncbi:MAG TPA: hypothetical protein VHK64_07370, partial [Nocardioidaceae bacterium]|nr:hypothetical protein [Nocardioidaceae bacterium]
MTPIPEGAAAVELPTLDDGLLRAVAAGSHHDPHSVLGQHQVAAPGVEDGQFGRRGLDGLGTGLPRGHQRFPPGSTDSTCTGSVNAS